MLFELWTSYTSEPEPPHLDRWLARRLGALERLPRDRRLWLGACLADGVRFAWLALLASECSGLDAGAALRHLRAGVGDLAAAWRRLAGVPPPEFFFHVFLRLRDAGATPPRLDEPGPGALASWLRVRAALAHDRSLPARLLAMGLPECLAADLARRAEVSGWSPEQCDLFLARQVTRPPLWLRLPAAADAAAVVAELSRSGFAVAPEGARSLAAVGERGIFELDCWRSGRVEIQDLASQRIGEAVQPQPGHFVWDVCAGSGGKTLQLAALMGGTGAVYATDPREDALADLRRRARRAGLRSVRAYPWPGDALPAFGSAVARRGGFDRVLVDAPCSGSGTWRRNPDGRLHTDPATLGDLIRTQARLLALAAGAVRPGGLLVYATCSWLTGENEDLVAGFLPAHPGFELMTQGLHGNPDADADTTFTAVMRRA